MNAQFYWHDNMLGAVLIDQPLDEYLQAHLGLPQDGWTSIFPEPARLKGSTPQAMLASIILHIQRTGSVEGVWVFRAPRQPVEVLRFPRGRIVFQNLLADMLYKYRQANLAS